MGAGMTDELCPQFGIIGAACSDPETLCDQYVFCKRARELQKEPDTLPSWAIEAIKTRIEKCRSEQDKYNRVGPCLEREFWYNRIEALKWVLALRKPEETE